MKPLVSISVVIWNGLADTKDCLESLTKISYPNYELIVVDNGSTDDSVKYIAKYYKAVKIIENGQNLGFTGGHNRAIKETNGKYILLLNNDIVVKPDFLEPLVADLEADSALAAVQSKTFLGSGLLDNVSSSLTMTGFLQHKGFSQSDSAKYLVKQSVFSPKAACLLVRKSVIDQIGLFDNDFFAYFEETDWAWRAALAGYKIVFEPKSVVEHKLGRTSKRLPPQVVNFHSFKNRLRSILKNASLKYLLIILPIHLVLINALAVSFLLQGKAAIFLSIIRAQLWNLRHLIATIRLRLKIQASRKLSDHDLFKSAMEPIDITKNIRQYLMIRKNF